MKDGAELSLGKAALKFVETPGHTPDSMCIFLSVEGAVASPAAIFTGDTLFVGSIGRPDLLGGKMSAAALASMAFDTWTQKLSKVDDRALVLPARLAERIAPEELRRLVLDLPGSFDLVDIRPPEQYDGGWTEWAARPDLRVESQPLAMTW